MGNTTSQDSATVGNSTKIDPFGNYLTITDAKREYQPKGEYLTSEDILGKYQPAGNYMFTNEAEARYQPKGNYLSINEGDNRYQPKGNYLTSEDIIGKYQPAGNYMFTNEAETRYQPKGNYLTSEDIIGKYQPAGNYMFTNEAEDKYQPKGNYLTSEDIIGKYQPAGNYMFTNEAETKYQPKGNYLTINEGDNKYQSKGAALISNGLGFDSDGSRMCFGNVSENKVNPVLCFDTKGNIQNNRSGMYYTTNYPVGTILTNTKYSIYSSTYNSAGTTVTSNRVSAGPICNISTDVIGLPLNIKITPPTTSLPVFSTPEGIEKNCKNRSKLYPLNPSDCPIDFQFKESCSKYADNKYNGNFKHPVCQQVIDGERNNIQGKHVCTTNTLGEFEYQFIQL